MMKSYIEARAIVPFPEVKGERVYMREFRPCVGLPADLRQWQPTVDAMMRGVETDGVAYLMVDQGFVRTGETLRRAGVHVDGYWMPEAGRHGHRSPLGAHGEPRPTHGTPQAPGHGTPPAGHGNPGRHGLSADRREAIILASDVTGCAAYMGDYRPEFGAGNDASAVDLSGLSRIEMTAGRAWLGNMAFLHESLPVPVDCYRTVVRLNVPNCGP
jgi:hypothetical protein